MMKEKAIRELTWILGKLDRRISALEMDSEGRGSESCSDDIEALESLLDRERQTDGPESTPEAT